MEYLLLPTIVPYGRVDMTNFSFQLVNRTKAESITQINQNNNPTDSYF